MENEKKNQERNTENQEKGAAGSSEIKAEKAVEKKEEIKEEKSNEAKAGEKKIEKKTEKIIKNEAFARGKDFHISKKHSMAICDLIRGRNIEIVISELEQVLKFKKSIPMKGEIPHRKGGKPGRYPINATKAFIKLLKNLSANASVNGIENAYIETAKADRASRPYRRFGSSRFKRTNILLIAKRREAKIKEKK